MKGFDYRNRAADNEGIDLPVAQWRAETKVVLAEGGWRRVKDGETFVKDANGSLVFEVYGNVSI